MSHSDRLSSPMQARHRAPGEFLPVAGGAAVFIIGAVYLGANAVNHHGMETGPMPDDLHVLDWRQIGATALTVEKGAHVRSGPEKISDDIGSNEFGTTDASVTLHLPSDITKIYTSEDTNGTWYCVSAEAVSEATNVDTAGAEDGLVCVNNQRAYLDLDIR